MDRKSGNLRSREVSFLACLDYDEDLTFSKRVHF
jgi:hypothetical protein